MIVQFFSYGDGLSKGPLDYLLGKDRDRDHARILSGSEAEIAGLIDSSPYGRKYTSGCLSFYESDLSDEAKRKIMDDFEKCLFPGLDQSQYRVLWIEHRDKVNEETGAQRLELNFLIPNVEIISGKSLQPFYHKADLPRVDLFKQKINYEHQLHDPDDPENKQPTTIAKNLPKNTKEFKQELNRLAEQAVCDGHVYDRDSMKKWLTLMSYEIIGEKPSSISIKNPLGDESSRPIRLTGTIYEQNFRYEDAFGPSSTAASERYRETVSKRYRDGSQRYEKLLEGKAAYHQRKYRTQRSEPERAGQPNYGRDHDPNIEKQSGVAAAAERSHERNIERDHDPSRAAAEEFYERLQRAVGFPDCSSSRPHEPDREPTSELSRIKPLTSRDSAASDYEKSPYYISLTPDFSSLYFSYMQHRSRVLPKKPKRPALSATQPGGRTEAERRELEAIELRQQALRTDRPESPDLRWQLQNSSGEITSEHLANRAIEDHRRATRAAEAATAAAKSRLAAFGNADWNSQSVAAANAFIGEEKQGNGADRQTLSRDCEEALRTNGLRAFFRGFTDRAKGAFKDVIDEVSQLFRLEKGSERLDKQHVAEHGTSRAREAERATNTRVGEIDSGVVFKALDKLDKIKELQRQKQKQQEYSSPSPLD